MALSATFESGTTFELKRKFEQTCEQYRDDFEFLRNANIGGEFMRDQDVERVEQLAQIEWTDASGASRPLLSQDEVTNLSIQRGTLNDDERKVINHHIVATIKMLESLPFPKNLQNSNNLTFVILNMCLVKNDF